MFSLFDARGRPRLAGCKKALATLAERVPQIVLPPPQGLAVDRRPRLLVGGVPVPEQDRQRLRRRRHTPSAERVAPVGALAQTNKDGASEVKVRGTYQGAPGYYYCKTDCQVQVRRGGISLYAGWRFVHDPDAQVSLPDSDYLYFGWWVRSNSSDDVPRLATAFFGFEGVTLEEGKTTSARDYDGSATFEGPAVGQYAIHDPRNGEGEGGAFEAKATLKARFGDPNNVRDAGLSGTIDEFRLNGGSEDPGWSVQLVKSRFESAGKKVTRRGTKTVMSIGDFKGPEVLNSWDARLFDTTPGTVADGGDGSNEADKILGTFYSEYSTTHRLVGAFGASNITKQNVNE